MKARIVRSEADIRLLIIFISISDLLVIIVKLFFIILGY